MKITRNGVELGFITQATAKRGTNPGGEQYFAPALIAPATTTEPELQQLLEFIGVQESYSMLATAYGQQCLNWSRRAKIDADGKPQSFSEKDFEAMVINSTVRVETIEDRLGKILAAHKAAKKSGNKEEAKRLLLEWTKLQEEFMSGEGE